MAPNKWKILTHMHTNTCDKFWTRIVGDVWLRRKENNNRKVWRRWRWLRFSFDRMYIVIIDWTQTATIIIIIIIECKTQFATNSFVFHFDSFDITDDDSQWFLVSFSPNVAAVSPFLFFFFWFLPFSSMEKRQSVRERTYDKLPRTFFWHFAMPTT